MLTNDGSSNSKPAGRWDGSSMAGSSGHPAPKGTPNIHISWVPDPVKELIDWKRKGKAGFPVVGIKGKSQKPFHVHGDQSDKAVALNSVFSSNSGGPSGSPTGNTDGSAFSSPVLVGPGGWYDSLDTNSGSTTGSISSSSSHGIDKPGKGRNDSPRKYHEVPSNPRIPRSVCPRSSIRRSATRKEFWKYH